jgi:hypothetical protein
LEENGMQATGSTSTFFQLGEPHAIAKLIQLHRDRDKPGQGSTNVVSATVSDDGMELNFQLKSEIEVLKPDLLLEQTGSSQLFRITVAKASLRSNDGNLMVVFASALESDFNGPDGQALQEAVRSFKVTDQSSSLLAYSGGMTLAQQTAEDELELFIDTLEEYGTAARNSM